MTGGKSEIMCNMAEALLALRDVGAHHPRELPDGLNRAIAEARIHPHHDHLNDLMDEDY